MQVATSLPTHIPTLHQMLLEQQQLIESLKAQLHRFLKHRFGPRSETIDVNQFGLFTEDGSMVVEVPEEASAPVTASKIGSKRTVPAQESSAHSQGPATCDS